MAIQKLTSPSYTIDSYPAVMSCAIKEALEGLLQQPSVQLSHWVTSFQGWMPYGQEKNAICTCSLLLFFFKKNCRTYPVRGPLGTQPCKNRMQLPELSLDSN